MNIDYLGFGIIQAGRNVGRSARILSIHGCDINCVHPDTLVTMSNFTQKKISMLIPGDEILGVKAKEGRKKRSMLCSQLVQHVWVSGIKEGYSLDFISGNIIGSGKHKIYSTRRGTYAELRNCNGSTGKMFPSCNCEFNKTYALGYINGACYGDGWFNTKQFSMDTVDKEFADRFVAMACLLNFKIRYSVAPYNKGSKYTVLYRIHTKQRNFISLLGNKKFDKGELFRGWVAGFFDAEGSWTKHCGITMVQTKDLNLMQEVSSRLNNLGYTNALYTQDIPKLKPKVLYRIQINKVRDSLKFFMWANPAIQRKFRPSGLEALEQVGLHVGEQCYTGEMWDIETSTGNFFANGLLVHNCSYCDKVLGEDGKDVTVDELFKEITALPSPSMLHINGGEPLFQSAELLEMLSLLGRRPIDIEVRTSGTVEIFGLLRHDNVRVLMEYKLPSSDVGYRMLESNVRALRGRDDMLFSPQDDGDVLKAQEIIQAVRSYKTTVACPEFCFISSRTSYTFDEMMDRMRRIGLLWSPGIRVLRGTDKIVS